MNIPATVNRQFSKTTVFVLLTLALAGLEAPTVTAQNPPNRSIESNSLADGTYLFGETPQLNQIGKGYLVLQRQQGKVVGAFYYPNSEFTCFTGQENNKSLSGKSLSSDIAKNENVKINLLNFHQIKAISANDQRMLSICKQVNIASINK